jgi:GTPase SAR1 family protein
LLASKAVDGPVRLWRFDTWECISVLDETARDSIGGLAFHPKMPILATTGEGDRAIYIWQMDMTALLSAAAPSDTQHYTNAKVVLVGDTGVGKSGLALALTGQPFTPTPSTHGRHICLFDSYEVPLSNSRSETREILLWDLAGQPGYRLIHQLYLHEVAVALVVFDARSETGPFTSVRYWDRALRQANRLRSDTVGFLKKYLVAARVDRGGIAASPQRIDAVVHSWNFDAYFETSAKEGWKIAELIDAIQESIDWEVLPKVSSTALFQTIKKFLVDVKVAGRHLSTINDLYYAFCQAYPSHTNSSALRAIFDTCISLVEGQGLIRRMSFGGCVLLQPELLDAYASALINSAKSEPDGLGYIAEEDALTGRFPIPTDERIADNDQERLLLIAVVEELLQHEIALKELSTVVVLVFPSQFTRERPDAPELPGKEVVLTFEGPVLNIYATLVVRLAHSHLFKLDEMWKDVTTYKANVGGICGIFLRELREGQGELTLFFDDKTTEETRYQFEDYVIAHLYRRALPDTIQRRKIVVCPDCKVSIPDDHIQRRRARGHTTINCSVCDTQIPLPTTAEYPVSSHLSTTVKMDQAADAQRDRDTAATSLKGKIITDDYDVFLCYNSQDRPAVEAISKQLKDRGILPWLDVWNIPPGRAWQRVLQEQITHIKSAAVFIGPRGGGPWQQLEQMALLEQFADRKCPVIPVILSGYEGKPELPPFLRLLHAVDYRILDPDPLEQLLWGITGERRHRG